MDIDTKLKPFVPEFLPAVGEVDAFLKIPRPDGKEEALGLERIDEPALNQSKRSYLDLLIREFYKGKVRSDNKEVHSIENPHKNPKLVNGWISDVEEIHKRRVAPSVFYSRKMPEINALMQPWDSDVEQAMSKVRLKDSDLPLQTTELAQIACNVFDIPVHDAADKKSLIESLHVLFSLYSAFAVNDHFQESQSKLGATLQKQGNVQRIEFTE